MAWEKRQGRGRYYTRSRRVNGRVVREYVGCGELSEAAAAADLFDRSSKRIELARLNAEQQRQDAADALLDQLANATGLLVRAALENAGYHQHDRGQWRRSRHAAQQPND
jgi:hypothetical protein